eukprot:SAG22_NODE_10035_length_557_cov_0.676856_1_plen_45_part_01
MRFVPARPRAHRADDSDFGGGCVHHCTRVLAEGLIHLLPVFLQIV